MNSDPRNTPVVQPLQSNTLHTYLDQHPEARAFAHDAVRLAEHAAREANRAAEAAFTLATMGSSPSLDMAPAS